METTATISFNDGTEMEVVVNGNCFILDEAPEFPEDITETLVTYKNGSTQEFSDPKVIECAAGFSPGYWFTLVEKGAVDQVEQNTANIDYLSAMTGIDL